MKKNLTILVRKPGSFFRGCSRLPAIFLVLLISVNVFARHAGTASIGDRLWLDANANGIQDLTEQTGISGILVQLRNAAGVVIATSTTNATGNYLFGALEAGTYTVVFPISTSSGLLTRQDQGADDSKDSDPDQATGKTAIITVSANQVVTNVDAGYYPRTMVLGGAVWADLDKDGIKNTRTGASIILDRGISGVTVKLYPDADNNNAADGPALGTAVTDADGEYRFINLSPGNYIVGVTTPAGFKVSVINGGDPDNDIDNDNNGTNTSVITEVRSNAVTVMAEQEPTTDGDNSNGNLTLDFGFDKIPKINSYLACCINEAGVITYGVNAKFGDETTTLYASYFNYAYQYKNAAGVWVCFAQGNNLINGKVISVRNAKGVGFISVASLLFDTLDPSLQGLVVRCVFSIGQNTDACSMPANNTFNSDNASLNQVVDLSSVTCKIFGSIGDRVWNDINRNGIQEAGEPGISDIPVELLNAAGSVIATTITNTEGIYNFKLLLAGIYSVRVKPAGQLFYGLSAKDRGADDNLDSDFDPVTFTTASLTLAQGQVRTDADAGLYKKILMKGNVWHDINGMSDNFVNNSGALATPPASPIPWLSVCLVNAATGLIERTAIVSASGTYAFADVTPNTNYFVYLITTSGLQQGSSAPATPTILPFGWKHTGQKLGITSGSDGINDGRLAVPVLTTDVENANFGIVLSGEITTG